MKKVRAFQLLLAGVVAIMLAGCTSSGSGGGGSEEGNAAPLDTAYHCEVTTPDGHDACAEDHSHAGRMPEQSPEEFLADIAAELEILRQREAVNSQPQSYPAPNVSYSTASSGSSTCSNSFGGPSASHGQYICSNQGEMLACQCGGGSCSTVPTGSFLCTRPGAVID